VILGFAFRDLIRGTPAKLNMNGSSDLRKPVNKLITGYPAEIAYTSNTLKGYFLHETGPARSIYSPLSGSAMETTLISSGPGNSGGPIWTKNENSGWTAAGVVVGGLPSESINYAFSSETNALLRAVAPIVKRSGPQSINSKELSASSVYYSSNKKIRLPDGVHRWTDVPFNVTGFDNESTVTAVRVAVKIKTSHRGDMQIMLTGPGGFNAIIHNEQGAGARDLIIGYKEVYEDLSEEFADISANGRWALRFQDRLKGDICTVESAVLELEADTPDAEEGGLDPGDLDPGGLDPGTNP
jgi:subtilisin-like proprotein convertase family protein